MLQIWDSFQCLLSHICLGLSLEWELDLTGGFRGKTLGNGFKLSLDFTSLGTALRAWADVVIQCLTLAATHPLHTVAVGSAEARWHHGAHLSCPGTQHRGLIGVLQGAGAPLPASTLFCLAHKILCLDGCWRQLLSLLKLFLPTFCRNALSEWRACEIFYWEWCAYAHLLSKTGTENPRHPIWKILEFLFPLSIPWNFHVLWYFPFLNYWEPEYLFLSLCYAQVHTNRFLVFLSSIAHTDWAAAYLSWN